MAEVIAAASAIAGLISLSGQILSEGYAFLGTIRRAPKELRQLLSETASLDTVLSQLQALVEDDQTDARSALKDLIRGGVIEESKELLDSVQRSVARCKQVKGEDFRNLGRILLWPFKEKETKDALTRLARVRGHLATALSVDTMTVLRDVQKSVRETSSGLTDVRDWTAKFDEAGDRRTLLQWLDPKPVNYEDNLKEALSLHHPGTGEWLFGSDPFQAWEAGRSSFLWVYGIPGSGKTVLASATIAKFVAQATQSRSALVYWFCDHRDSSKRKFHGCAVAGVLQLLKQRREGFNEVEKLFDKDDNDPKIPLRTEDYLKLFGVLAASFNRVTVIIDALDECEEQGLFIEGLKALLNTEGTMIKVLVTSRSDFALEQILAPLVNADCRISLVVNTRQDIVTYITHEVNARIQSRMLKIRNPTLKQDIISALANGASGMFMLVKLQLDLMCRLADDKSIRDSLQELPRGLDATYIRLLQQIKARNPENINTVKRLLTWLVGSFTPLTLDQLAEAVAIDTDDRYRDIDKMATDPEDLLTMLGSLVTIDQTRVVSLAHFTLDAFLQSDSLRNDNDVSMFYVSSQESQLALAIACAQYLSFLDFREPCRTPASLLERKETYKFLAYAAYNWFEHVNTYEAHPNSSIGNFVSTCTWFIEPNLHEQQLISWLQISNDKIDDKDESDPLYYAIAFGLPGLLDIMLRKRLNATVVFQDGYTPLALAAKEGRDSVVQRILEDRPNLEATVPRGRTALHLAAEWGNARTVRLLLDAGASPNARSNSETTPFYRAARSGSLETLDLLYQAGSDVNAKTYDGWTPIFEAIEKRFIWCVHRLIQMGADLDVRLLSSGLSVLEFAQDLHSSGPDKDIIRMIEGAIEARGSA